MSVVRTFNDRESGVPAVFDLDKTVTRRDTWLAFLFFALLRNPARLMRAAWLPFAVAAHLAGFRSNAWLKEKFLAAVFGGNSRACMEELAARFTQKLLSTGIRVDAATALAAHKKQGHYLVCATASFDIYVVPLAQQLGFDAVVCTEAGWDARSCLSGKIEGENCYGQAKFARVAALFPKNGRSVTAYSDHHTDLPLLMWADEAYAVNPTQRLREAAAERGIAVLSWR